MMKKLLIASLVASLAGAASSAASPTPSPPRLWVMAADGTDQRVLGSEASYGYGDSSFSWAPDSRRGVAAGLTIIDVTTGEETELTGGIDDNQADWSPVSNEIAFSRTTGAEESYDRDLYLINADGSGLRLLVDSPEPDVAPAWSPDGSRIAFVSGLGDGQEGAVFVVNADGSGLRRISSAPALYVAPEWSPDGSRVVFETFDYQLYMVEADGSDERPVVPYGSRQATWCPDGTLYFVGAIPAHGGPVIQSVRGDEVRTVVEGSHPDCASSGKLAFSRDADIHLIDPGRAGSPNLTASQDRSDEYPRWSPDAAKIAFVGTDSLPGPVAVERTVTISLRKHLRVSGRLTSTEGTCLTRVKIQKLADRGWRTIATVRPDETGRFSGGVRDRRGYYRVLAPRRQKIYGTYDCLRAVSEITRHRH